MPIVSKTHDELKEKPKWSLAFIHSNSIGISLDDPLTPRAARSISNCFSMYSSLLSFVCMLLGSLGGGLSDVELIVNLGFLIHI
jgi:hypothetical protein